MNGKVRLILPTIAIIGILIVFIFVLNIFNGLDIDSSAITLKGIGGLSDVYEYRLDDFNSYLLGFVILIYTVVVLAKFDSFTVVHRKIELILIVILSAVLLFVSNKYMNSMTGICTASIPAFCSVTIDSSESIVWLFRGTMIAFVLYDVILFMDIYKSYNKNIRNRILIYYGAPFLILILLPFLFLGSQIYLLFLIAVLIYLVALSTYNIFVRA